MSNYFAKSVWGLPLLLSMAITPNNANALEGVKFLPQVGIQMKSLDFSQEAVFPGVGSIDGGLDVDMPTLTLALTAVSKGAYLSFKYEMNFSDATASDSDVPFTNADTDVDRQDLGLTLGYNIWKGMNVFVGYMSGETEFSPELGFVGSTQNTATLHQANGGGSYRQDYEEDGFYLGVSYGQAIGDVGTLSGSLAYAFLDATYDDNFADRTQRFKYEGDANGLSIGISWSAPINDSMAYFVDLRRQKYELEGDDTSGNFANSTVETDETMLVLGAGIRFYF